MKRRPSISITDLVKQVAEEVFDEKFEEVFEDKLKDHQATKPIVHYNTIDCKEYLKELQNSLNNVGTAWSQREEEVLHQELKCALGLIAANHGRTMRAIALRITQKQILEKIE